MRKQVALILIIDNEQVTRISKAKSDRLPGGVFLIDLISCKIRFPDYSLVMAKTLTVTEAARNFSDVVNRVFYRGESLELTRGGKVVARLIPACGIEAPTGGQVLEAWKFIPHLTKEEADAFAKDIESGREVLNRAPSSKWE